MRVEHPHLGPIHHRFADFLDRLAAHNRGLTRSEFRPWDYAPFLPNLLLMERAPDGDYAYRLAGTAVEGHLGRKVTGERLAAVRTGRTLSDIRHLLDTALGERKVGVYRSQGVSEVNANRLYHRLVAPLSGPDGDIALGLWMIERNPDGAQTPLGEFAFCGVDEAFSGCADIASAARASA